MAKGIFLSQGGLWYVPKSGTQIKETSAAFFYIKEVGLFLLSGFHPSIISDFMFKKGIQDGVVEGVKINVTEDGAIELSGVDTEECIDWKNILPALDTEHLSRLLDNSMFFSFLNSQELFSTFLQGGSGWMVIKPIPFLNALKKSEILFGLLTEEDNWEDAVSKLVFTLNPTRKEHSGVRVMKVEDSLFVEGKILSVNDWMDRYVH